MKVQSSVKLLVRFSLSVFLFVGSIFLVGSKSYAQDLDVPYVPTPENVV